MDFEGMTKPEVEAMLKRLTARAATKLNKLVWRGKRGNPAPAGAVAEDIVTDALTALFDGTRPRKPKTYPLLEDQLRGIVDSMVSNRVTGADNRLVSRSGAIEEVACGRFDEEARLLAADYTKMIHDALLERVIDDEQLLEAVDLLMKEGTMDPADLESKLGISKKDAYNVVKRLRRAIQRAVQALEEGGSDGQEA